MKNLFLVIASFICVSAYADESYVCSGAGSNLQAFVTIGAAGVTANVAVNGVAAEPITSVCNIRMNTIHCASELGASRYEIYPMMVGARLMQVNVIEWQEQNAKANYILNSCRAGE